MKRLTELSDNYEFKIGTKLRHYNVLLNAQDKRLDYFDYILSYALWLPNEMMLVNITIGSTKAGGVYGGTIKLDRTIGRIIVKMKDMKCFFGEDIHDWYLTPN